MLSRSSPAAPGEAGVGGWGLGLKGWGLRVAQVVTGEVEDLKRQTLDASETLERRASCGAAVTFATATSESLAPLAPKPETLTCITNR
jgi:hypothetical protein